MAAAMLAGFLLGVIATIVLGFACIGWLMARETREATPPPGGLLVSDLASTTPPARPGETGWLARLGDPDDRFADTPDGRYANIHPAIWNASGTPAEGRVYGVPDAFWDEVGSIQIDGLGDLNP